MKHRLHIFMAFVAAAGFLMLCACGKNSADNTVAKNIPEITSQTTVDDSQNDWGEPSPPPTTTGNPDDLFAERRKKQDSIQVATVEEWVDEEYEWRSLDPVAIYEDIMRRVAYSSSGKSRRRGSETSTNAANSAGKDEFSLHYDLEQEAASSSQQPSADMQPSGTSGTNGKMNFLQSFYARMLATGGTQIDEYVLTTSCRNYLREYAQEQHVNMARRFRTSKQKPTKSQGEMLRNLNIQPLADDWFAVTIDEGFGPKRIEIKVVEVNGGFLIDMVK